jgi:hypothetical protein
MVVTTPPRLIDIYSYKYTYKRFLRCNIFLLSITICLRKRGILTKVTYIFSTAVPFRQPFNRSIKLDVAHKLFLKARLYGLDQI